MLFNSVEFLIFFPVVAVLHFLLPHYYRWFLLLGASCIFYMYFIPVYILILIFTIIIDYFAGIWIEDAASQKLKRRFLIGSITANVGVLAVFKYYNFFIGNLNVAFHDLPLLKIALPIGLSFHTFQAMSYTIEVYRGRQKAELQPGIYALYVMFFPQLVAGPIERPQNILYQFYEEKYFDYQRVTDGLRRMLWGFFQKIVIADRLAILTDPVFNHPRDYNAPSIFVAVVFFSFQIFCDFAGYSDIAIGSAQVLGFRLMENFDRPYHARSISEFWSRWHISLSTWFRDYLYIPLGGNRVSIQRRYFNLFIVFLISGFWHGANWTFLVWGAIHGCLLIFEIMSAPVRRNLSKWSGIAQAPKLKGVVERLVTFTLVALAWIFFRANTLGDALYMLQKAPHGLLELQFSSVRALASQLPQSFGIKNLIISIFAILTLEGVHALQKERKIERVWGLQPALLRWSWYYGLTLIIVIFGVFERRQFIYFQF